VSTASETNRATYDRLWAGLGDFTRYNPGARHRRRWVLELLERRRFSSLLDVGCGNGLMLSLIDARFPGRRLAGADLSEVALEENRRVLPHMQFHAVDLAKDGLPEGFDVVTCCEVIEHLDDQPGALKKLAASVVPGGAVLVTCPTGPLYPTEKHFGHVRHPTPDELVGWARDAGLEPVQVVSWGFPFYALTKWATNLKPDMALERFGMEKSYGVAEKAVSGALYLLNYANVPSSSRGVQLFALFQKKRA
jgi:SAM-dependent methyltransferase